MFRVDMLPARQGDALWIEYGDAEHPSRILIDAGPTQTKAVIKRRILGLPLAERRFELVIITHIDTDHIGGALGLLADSTVGLQIGEIWFNSWQHLPNPTDDKLGPIDGELLSCLVERLGVPWNKAFGNSAVVVPSSDPPPERELPGGMKLTLLSPTEVELVDLRRNWAEVIRAAGIDPNEPRTDDALTVLRELAAKKGVPADLLGTARIDVEALAGTPFKPDRSAANGSSIVVLAEFNEKRVVLGADGFPAAIEASIRNLLHERGKEKLALDALKVPHHGSAHNITDTLLSVVSCDRFLFSTNGRFGHPDDVAVAKVIVHGGQNPTLAFNYRFDSSRWWTDNALKTQFAYETAQPLPGAEGLAVDL